MDSWEHNLRLTLCSQCGWNQVGRSALPNWLLTRLDQRFASQSWWDGPAAAAAAAAQRGLLDMQILRSIPPNQTFLEWGRGLCFNQPSRWCRCTFKFENHWIRSFYYYLLSFILWRVPSSREDLWKRTSKTVIRTSRFCSEVYRNTALHMTCTPSSPLHPIRESCADIVDFCLFRPRLCCFHPDSPIKSAKCRICMKPLIFSAIGTQRDECVYS